MINWINLLRLFRRHLIFGLILVFLLTYCILNSFRSEKRGLNFGNDFDDMDNMNIGENDYIFNDEDPDEVIKTPGKPLLWQMEVMNDLGNADSIELTNYESLNENDTASTKSCRNSVQGKSLIVDEKGFVCTRQELQSNGCCSIDDLKQSKTTLNPVPSIKKLRYTCETCNSEGCCTVYEYCVACCLDPKKIKKKKIYNFNHIKKENLKLRRGEDILKLRLRNLDRFQLCLAACRTSSASVQHENTYKNPQYKHCYILQLPNNHVMQRHKRNAFTNNNDLKITFTSL